MTTIDVFTSTLRDDPQKLSLLYDTLIEKNPELRHIWFILYKQKYPCAIMEAYESHYVKLFPAPVPFSLIHCVIDIGLQINYANALNTSDKFYTRHDEDGFLRPSVKECKQWTVFQVKMRRLAFRLFREMIDKGMTIQALGQEVKRICSADWTSETMDENAVIEFFSPLPADVIKKYYVIVNEEIVYDDNTTFLSHFETPDLIIDKKKFDFIDHDNDEKFRQLVLRLE
jgi:hypothetical protein